MPHYMDVHHMVEGLSTEFARMAHQKDLDVQQA
jgi:hypothetical protein